MALAVDDYSGAEHEDAPARSSATGERGYDGAAEGRGLSDGCAVVSERVTDLSAAGQARGPGLATKLYATGATGLCATWAVRQRPDGRQSIPVRVLALEMRQFLPWQDSEINDFECFGKLIHGLMALGLVHRHCFDDDLGVDVG